MKIETQPLENHQVKLTVAVDAEQFEDAKQRAARKLAKRTKIPGFRPGKAPYPILLRHIGESTIVSEAIESMVQDVYKQAVEESGIETYGPGELEDIPQTDPPTFEFILPLKATVELGDYRSIRQPYELKEVGDEDVEKVIQDLRQRQAVSEPVERPIQEGDVAYLRLSAKRTQPQEDEDPTILPEESYPFLVKEADQEEGEEWPFPGFYRQLIGLSAGDERTLTHTFSENSQFESLRNVEAEFHFTVEEVKLRVLPELNDELAQSAGDFANLDELRAGIRQDLEQQTKSEYHQEYDDKILDELVKISTVQYPPQMLENEIDNVIEQLEDRLKQQKQDLDLYLKTREMEIDGLREEARPVAESRLKRALILMEVADAEKIEIKPEELEAETTQTMNQIAQMLPEKEMRKFSNKNVVSGLIGNILMDLTTKRTLERMRAIASGQAELETEATAHEASATNDSEIAPETGSEPSAEVEAEPEEVPQAEVVSVETENPGQNAPQEEAPPSQAE